MLRLLPLLLLLACATNSPADTVSETPIDLSELTIAEIHAAYRAGDYTSEGLVTAYFARMDSLDGQLNAITIRNPEALATARGLDAEFAETGTLRPLHGIPLLVKDNINTAGMPTTAGSRALADFVPENDAFIIARLREAGAILIAKTNMAEWAFSPMHSESTTAGTTRNPYDLDHVPAGSSGGTAAAVAANLATVGLGTDTGNSIRGPSSHNALVGFRTTLGLISREGIVPLYLRNDVVGPMTRTVADATHVLQAMTGVDAADPITRRSEGKVPADYTKFLDPDGLRGARLGVLRALSDDDPDPEIAQLFSLALNDLERLGATVVDPVEVPRFQELRQAQWCNTFRRDVEDFLATYVKRDTVASLEDIIRIGTDSDYARGGLEEARTTTGRYGDSEVPCGDAYTDPRRIAFREAIEATMDSLELDAIVFPSWNHPAAQIDNFEEGYRGDNSQVISPHTGQPGFTVPMGFTESGLPAGLQFLGRMYAEPTLIRVTSAYEQGTHLRRPPGLDR
ncbi:Asp-tRNA(Asn)/Glu-tRNA(Gln) amidotransferase A subunit family amidase [Neolewinella xylanilytica]|uniref:Asp-tRNA(Asn)/Glu-tRNA(Gln) amidotransferase A subunit family amidase n=1 Tax=Neolewinella xylanilytica TaxID=1514080 RepID=A0A2S6I6M7_9BACT|nr:amidase family protein [Neolewinella xylanilytica]PPK87129.1 Asp-tRNA(Asn)/Glu-tRNA(Gln) amidotransferase A subunit family amidase [Neolewinella xylanilytica]